MPRIKTPTLADHRDWRRSQLIEAAAAIALESGGAAVTVAAVAQRVVAQRERSNLEWCNQIIDLGH